MTRTMRIPAAMALLLLGAAAVAPARERCGGSDDAAQWKRFTEAVDRHYLRPAGLRATELSLTAIARVLGHALGSQASAVGRDEARRAAFDCLEQTLLERLMEACVSQDRLLGGDSSGCEAQRLSEVVEDAKVGFWDEEIRRLTGRQAADAMPSILGRTPASATSASAGPDFGVSPSPAESATVEQDPRVQCRFNLHPTLYTDAHPSWPWYLLRRPWRRSGYQYLAIEVKPAWDESHPKRPENHLASDEVVVIRGSKQEVRERVAALQKECS